MGEAHAHCWHGDGWLLPSLPAQERQQCCHCGEQRVVAEELPDGDEHGPYFELSFEYAELYG